MSTRATLLTCIVLFVGTLLYTAMVYPSLPQLIPTHWNIRGQIDGWSNKQVGAWLMPCFAVFTGLLGLALPVISPRGFRVEKFRETFNYVIVIVVALLVFIQVITIETALHPNLDTSTALSSGVFLFLALIGNVLGRVKRNFWLGIRTPWTLASDDVWYATHRFGARGLFAIGVFGCIGVWFGVPLWLPMSLLIAWAVLCVVYSAVLSAMKGGPDESGSDAG